MVSLVTIPSVFPGVSRLAFPVKKACGSAGKRTGDDINAVGCFSPASACNSNIIIKSRLGAAAEASDVSVAETEMLVINGVGGEKKAEAIPKHVGVIMDGNGRWAQNRGLKVQDGHLEGITTLKHLAINSSLLGINLLSVYAFSSQNWSRSHKEVEFLMRVFQHFIQSTLLQLFTQHDIRFSVIGDKSKLPEYLQSAIASAEEMSGANKGMHLVMALNYGGREDIVEAAKKIASKVEEGIVRASEVDEAMLDQEMMTNNLEFPDLDLVIRTSGELRLSNFLLWQSAYTELYFTDTLFPDFGLDHLREALTSYQSRKRRYGKRN